MAITKEQALTGREFHIGCSAHVGPRGGVTMKTEVWRRSGMTQTWKTRPAEFRIPVKFGLKTSSYITERDAYQFHLAEECPVCTLVQKHRNDPEGLRAALAALDA